MYLDKANKAKDLGKFASFIDCAKGIVDHISSQTAKLGQAQH